MRVLILCTGNSCRSQMAEGFIRHYLGEGSIVRSAGITTHGVNPRAIKVMGEIAIDISQHTSNNVQEYVNETFDHIITVCDNAAENCPVFPGGGEKLHWPFDDPAGAVGTEEEILAEFRRVRDEIGTTVTSWLKSHTID